jgi:hypothetical protein
MSRRIRSNHIYTQPVQTLASRTKNTQGYYNENEVVLPEELSTTSNIVAGDSLILPTTANTYIQCVNFSTLRLNVNNNENTDYLNLNVYQTDNVKNGPFYSTKTKIEGLKTYHENIPIESQFLRVELDNPNLTDVSNVSVYGALTKYSQFQVSNQLQNTVKPFDYANLVRHGNEFRNDVILSKYDNIKKINIAGQFESLIASNSQLFANSTNPYTIMNTPDTFDISGSLAADRGISIHIEGITTGGLVQEEDINLDAVDASTPVTTINSYIRINRMFVNDAPFNSANTVNVGDITAFSTTSGYFMEIIPATYNQSMTAKYCVPSGKYLVIKNFNLIGSLSNHNPTIIFNKYSDVFGGLNYIIKKIRFDDWQGIQTQDDLNYLFKENEELYITIDTIAGTPQNDFLTIQLEGYLYDNLASYEY